MNCRLDSTYNSEARPPNRAVMITVVSGEDKEKDAGPEVPTNVIVFRDDIEGLRIKFFQFKWWVKSFSRQSGSHSWCGNREQGDKCVCKKINKLRLFQEVVEKQESTASI